MTILIITLISALVSAVLYRLGGWEKGNRLFRILGVPLVALAAWWLMAGFTLSHWWAYLLTFGLSAGAISAYWGQDERPWGYWIHGLGIGLAMAVLAFVTGHWIGFGIRTVVLTVGIAAWSEYTHWDILEECGRGAIIGACTPLMMI